MADDDVGKLLVFRMSRETTEEALKDYFSKYGDVSMTAIAKDKVTNISRGFGFVTFLNPSSADVALRDCHVISDRTVEVKKATPSNMQQTNNQQDVSTSNGSYSPNNNIDQSWRSKKIFVGGLPSNLTNEDFKSYFEKFGSITNATIMHDKNTNRPRGFGFITFDSEQVVEDLMQVTRQHELAGKLVEVKRAVPREAIMNYSYNNCNNCSNRGRYTSQGYTNPDLYYSGGYPFCNFMSYGYEMPIFITHGLWSSCPTPYGTGYYPTTLNGGVGMMGMVNPYNTNGKSIQDFRGDNNVY